MRRSYTGPLIIGLLIAVLANVIAMEIDRYLQASKGKTVK